MDRVPATIARQKWAETLDAAKQGPVVITSHGRDVAVVMGAELAERALTALEDANDIKAAEEALADPSPRVTLSELARELGIALDE